MTGEGLGMTGGTRNDKGSSELQGKVRDGNWRSAPSSVIVRSAVPPIVLRSASPYRHSEESLPPVIVRMASPAVILRRASPLSS